MLILILIVLSFTNAQKLNIKASGLVEFGENDMAMVFYITVIEEGPTGSRIYVEMVECCENLSKDESDCGTIQLTGGDMDIAPFGTERNLTLFFPTLYGYNRRGACLVDIIYNANATKLRHRIEFDTVIRNDQVPTGLQQFYDPTEIKICDSLDQDPFNDCEPVTCQAKYMGHRNYFNPETLKCEKAISCPINTIYLPAINDCREIGSFITEEDIKEINRQLPISDLDDETLEVVCHRGKPVMGTCVCDPGWTTIRNDDSSVGSLHMCNAPCTDIFSSPTLIFTHIFDVIFALVVAGLIVIMIYCSERQREKNLDWFQFKEDAVDCMYFEPVR